MDNGFPIEAKVDAERLLREFDPTPDEASFIREQGEAIFLAVLNEFLKRTKDRSVRLRPMTLEMAVAYPAFAVSAWARHAESEETESESKM